MKLLLTLIILLLTPSIYGQDDPGAYLGQLGSEYNQINSDTWDYIKLVTRGRNASRVEKRRQDLIVTLRKAKYNVSRAPSFNGDTSLKKAFSNYLGLTYDVMANGYSRIVDMERVAEESYDAMEAYLMTKELAGNKMDSAYQVLLNSQNAFVEKYNVPVRDDQSRTTIKLESYGILNEYYNDVYLIFFKSSFYEAEMMKAVSEERIGDMEQFRQTLATVSKEGMTEVKKIGNFKGDNSLVTACHRMLDFFYGEAVRYMPEQIEFYAKKDRFERLNKNMESKNKKTISRDEAREYNDAINAYNQAINDFNITNEYLNKHRTLRHESFNEAIENFYKEHL